ncbi:hypothetical protein Tco_1043096 [Tanacetum coccineum]|uniref:Uncharacterized protein n=1 Tax=Tanacetum coccineum TaxID=301880 RepID=A0ABQ5GL88_9ASTR
MFRRSYAFELETLKKEKVDVTRGKGIELLSQVALNEDAQFKEVQRKNMRDFHKNHPSSSGAVKIIPSVTSKGTGVKPEVPDVTEEESSENNENKSDSEHKKDENDSDSKFDQEENEEDKEEEEVVKTPSNNSDDEDETKITDKAEGNEDEEMGYTTVIEDAHVILSTVPQKTKVPVSSSSHSSDLAAKFLNFLDIPTTEAELVLSKGCYVIMKVSSKQLHTLMYHVVVTLDLH